MGALVAFMISSSDWRMLRKEWVAGVRGGGEAEGGRGRDRSDCMTLFKERGCVKTKHDHVRDPNHSKKRILAAQSVPKPALMIADHHPADSSC